MYGNSLFYYWLTVTLKDQQKQPLQWLFSCTQFLLAACSKAMTQTLFSIQREMDVLQTSLYLMLRCFIGFVCLHHCNHSRNSSLTLLLRSFLSKNLEAYRVLSFLCRLILRFCFYTQTQAFEYACMCFILTILLPFLMETNWKNMPWGPPPLVVAESQEQTLTLQSTFMGVN